MLRLLHLSDIHFNEKAGVIDEHIEIRDAIEKDLKILMAQNNKPIDYILICGDIAFSGKAKEYHKARNWLDTICGIVKCKSSSVLMVPGNHDVDRDIIKKSYLQKTIHDSIDAELPNRIDDVFRNLVENNHIDILKIPQTHYNDFASIYDCNTKSNQLYWELKHNDFNGFQLVFRGCNSALLSDENDQSNPCKMVLTKYQHYVKDDYKTLYITLCHHPLNCMKDKSNIELSFNSKVAVQLYGHNHQYHVETSNQSLIINAGAVTPESGDGYNSCYNIIDMQINSDNLETQLEVAIWIREWDGEKFVSGVNDGNLFERHKVIINDSTKSWNDLIKKDNKIVEITKEHKYADTVEIPTINELLKSINSMEKFTERDVRYEFLILPFRKRQSIGNDLIPHSFDNSQMSEMERSLDFLNSIKEHGRFNELWNKIKA